MWAIDRVTCERLPHSGMAESAQVRTLEVAQAVGHHYLLPQAVLSGPVPYSRSYSRYLCGAALPVAGLAKLKMAQRSRASTKMYSTDGGFVLPRNASISFSRNPAAAKHASERTDHAECALGYGCCTEVGTHAGGSPPNGSSRIACSRHGFPPQWPRRATTNAEKA